MLRRFLPGEKGFMDPCMTWVVRSVSSTISAMSGSLRSAVSSWEDSTCRTKVDNVGKSKSILVALEESSMRVSLCSLRKHLSRLPVVYLIKYRLELSSTCSSCAKVGVTSDTTAASSVKGDANGAIGDVDGAIGLIICAVGLFLDRNLCEAKRINEWHCLPAVILSSFGTNLSTLILCPVNGDFFRVEVSVRADGLHAGPSVLQVQVLLWRDRQLVLDLSFPEPWFRFDFVLV